MKTKGLPRSLTALCKEWLGKEIDKGEQVSDWDMRPLSEEQKRYAAVDAWVLCAIFDECLKSDPAQCQGVWMGKLRTLGGREEEGGGGEGGGKYTWSVDGSAAAGDGGGGRGEEGGNGGDASGGNGVCVSVEEMVRQALAAKALSPSSSIVFVNENDEDTLTHPHTHHIKTKSIALIATLNKHTPTPTLTPLLILAPATAKVQLACVSMCLGLPRAALRLATPGECVCVFGFPPGRIPPVGHKVGARLIVDVSLTMEEQGGGEGEEGQDTHAQMLGEEMVGEGGGETQGTHTQMGTYTEGQKASTKPRLVCGSGEEGRVFVCDVEDLLVLGGPGAMVAPVCTSTSSPSSSLTLTRTSAHTHPHTQEVSFLVDSMLGRLSKWLRVLGVDVEFHSFDLPSILAHKGTHTHTHTLRHTDHLSGGGKGPPAIVASAQRSGRIILTRDKKLAESRYLSVYGVCVCLLSGNDTRGQLEQLVRRFGIAFEVDDLMSRCSGELVCVCVRVCLCRWMGGSV